jgi:lipoprotein signal peptidase
VQLTQEERENLVFQDGDFYEVLAGVLSISSQHEGKHPNSAATVMQITFFFESSDPNWGTQEWMTTFGGSIPEGPALLVLYRRGNHGNAFGIVSMANRAWTHIVPILGAPLIQDSHKAGELKKLEVKSLGGVVGGAIAAAAVSRLTFGIGQKKMTEKFAGKMGHGNYREAAEKIEATVRSFMFRIAKDAESYWEDGGNSMSGRL